MYAEVALSRQMFDFKDFNIMDLSLGSMIDIICLRHIRNCKPDIVRTEVKKNHFTTKNNIALLPYKKMRLYVAGNKPR